MRFTIRNKILLSFFVLIIVFIFNAALSVITINRSDNIINESSENIRPTLESINEFRNMVTRSRMLITNWVYLQSNTGDKDALKKLQDEEYPQLKERLIELKADWKIEEEKQKLDSILGQFEELLAIEKEIMGQLISFEDYENPLIKFTAEDNIENQILPQSNLISQQLDEIAAIKQKDTDDAESDLITSFGRVRSLTLILAVIIVLLASFAGYLVSRSITRPIYYIQKIIQDLSIGKLPEKTQQIKSNDEVGDMAQAVEKLVTGLDSTSQFAENIGNGKYDSEFDPLSEEDVLGNSLIEMRDNLKRVSDEDRRRNWTTEGLAKFGEILRNNNDNIIRLSDEIVSNLVKYVNANQGGLFIINDVNDEDVHLELTACYAWDKKKFLEQKIYEGEGLIGQVWLEKEHIYMTDVPRDYVNITSGLGEALPSSILLVPLRVNEDVYGVIEIASFYEFEDYQIEFVEKVAESIGSTISSVKINERTQRLLEDSQELTEQMRAQEEEMRQNMEELQATQEEMHRGQREREQKESIINDTQLVLELDSNLTILNTNSVFRDLLHYTQDELEGRSIYDVLATKDAMHTVKDTLESGSNWSGVLKMEDKSGNSVMLKASAGTMSDSGNFDSKYLLFATDITHVAV